MLKVGITGGIGSGKSIICRFFALLGIPVYDSDGRAKWVMQHDALLKDQLQQAFGEAVYAANGQLDRPFLSGLVFHQPEKLTLLNNLVHPRVKEDFDQWAATWVNAPYLLKEAALMFESKAYQQVNKVITVSAPVEVRLARVLQRDPHRRAADVQAIINKQLPEEERQQRADYIIYNEDQQLVIPQALALHEQLLALRKSFS